MGGAISRNQEVFNKCVTQKLRIVLLRVHLNLDAAAALDDPENQEMLRIATDSAAHWSTRTIGGMIYSWFGASNALGPPLLWSTVWRGYLPFLVLCLFLPYLISWATV